MLGFELLAACRAGRRMLPEAHPIACYVRHIGTRLAESSSMPYSAAGLDYLVIQDGAPDAMAMPGDLEAFVTTSCCGAAHAPPPGRLKFGVCTPPFKCWFGG